MITDIDAFLRYFDAVHRRALRDIGALPPEAERWAPTGGEGENAWSIGEIVRHIAGTRMYWARAYRGEGWIADWEVPITESQSSWLPALEASAAEFRKRLEGTPNEWLTRKVPMLDSGGALSGWRLLMMMLEHEIHHRSQIDTYAGLQGWPVPDIYGRSAEQVGLQRPRQRELHPDG
jgi:uncharacterized damage-inducible protein DinB